MEVSEQGSVVGPQIGLLCSQVQEAQLWSPTPALRTEGDTGCNSYVSSSFTDSPAKGQTK